MFTMPQMIRTASLNVASHAYVPEESSLYVAYKGSESVIYRYDVSPEEYGELIGAVSFGSHLARHIKSRGCAKICVD